MFGIDPWTLMIYLCAISFVTVLFLMVLYKENFMDPNVGIYTIGMICSLGVLMCLSILYKYFKGLK